MEDTQKTIGIIQITPELEERVQACEKELAKVLEKYKCTLAARMVPVVRLVPIQEQEEEK